MEESFLSLSGKSKPFSKKKTESQHQQNEKRSKDSSIFSKFKPSSVKSDKNQEKVQTRPKTAATRKPGSNFPISVTLSRPSSSSSSSNKIKTVSSRFRLPGLKAAPSVDSAVGSQLSSTDDDNKSSSDDEHDEHESDESSEDSGIIKVRVVSRSTNGSEEDGSEQHSSPSQSSSSTQSSPSARAIFVKEFNRTPDIDDADDDVKDDDNEDVEENIVIEQFIESEDEESKAEPLLSNRNIVNNCHVPDEEDDPDFTGVNRDVVLLEVGPEDKSEIIANIKIPTVDNDEEEECNILTVDDIEEVNVDEDIKNADTTVTEPSSLGHSNLLKTYDSEESHSKLDIEQKVYNPGLYENHDAVDLGQSQQNSSLLQLMTADRKPSECYKDRIESTIMKLEQEEVDKPEETQAEEDRLSNEELENLKKKCMTRMKHHETVPLVTQPPVLMEFSNSQKLLNYLDQAEEKDKSILNSVKRSSYNIQVYDNY